MISRELLTCRILLFLDQCGARASLQHECFVWNQMQPFPDEASLYSPYYTTNNWTSKVPSPLGGPTKGFSWGSPAMTPSVPLFPSTATAVQSAGNGVIPSVTSPGSSMVTGPAGAATCPYVQAPSSPYSMYRDQCSTSLATLRLKARQHVGFGTYGTPSPGRQGNGLSQSCQYSDRPTVWFKVVFFLLTISKRYASNTRLSLCRGMNVFRQVLHLDIKTNDNPGAVLVFLLLKYRRFPPYLYLLRVALMRMECQAANYLYVNLLQSLHSVWNSIKTSAMMQYSQLHMQFFCESVGSVTFRE